VNDGKVKGSWGSSKKKMNMKYPTAAARRLARTRRFFRDAGYGIVQRHLEQLLWKTSSQYPFGYASFGRYYLVRHQLIRNCGTRIGCRALTVVFLYLRPSEWYLFKT
jgi:hypothetical protein